MNDSTLEHKINDLQETIISWASERGLWTDSSFSSYQEYFDVEPSMVTPTVTILCTEGGLFSMFNGFSYGEELEEFGDLVRSKGFYYEMHKPYVIEFFPANDELNQYYLDYFEWRWIAEIIKPDYTNLYQEVFEFFHANPTKLISLSPRKFEILLGEIFSNQGYRTVLGKGQGDEGVDVRIYQKDDVDQIPILVQAKRYKKNPIKMEAVAALTGCVVTENARQGIFVTTSRYLPVAKRFASRKNSQITLADSNDVQNWCKTAGTLLDKDRSLMTSDDQLLQLIKPSFSSGLVGKVVVGGWGFDMINNDFCIIVKDTPHVALLMKIPSLPTYSDVPYNMMGNEVPLLNEDIIKCRISENFYRARKTINETGEITFWTKDMSYGLWDGAPRYFNHID